MEVYKSHESVDHRAASQAPLVDWGSAIMDGLNFGVNIESAMADARTKNAQALQMESELPYKIDLLRLEAAKARGMLPLDVERKMLDNINAGLTGESIAQDIVSKQQQIELHDQNAPLIAQNFATSLLLAQRTFEETKANQAAFSAEDSVAVNLETVALQHEQNQTEIKRLRNERQELVAAGQLEDKRNQVVSSPAYSNLVQATERRNPKEWTASYNRIIEEFGNDAVLFEEVKATLASFREFGTQTNYSAGPNEPPKTAVQYFEEGRPIPDEHLTPSQTTQKTLEAVLYQTAFAQSNSHEFAQKAVDAHHKGNVLRDQARMSVSERQLKMETVLKNVTPDTLNDAKRLITAPYVDPEFDAKLALIEDPVLKRTIQAYRDNDLAESNYQMLNQLEHSLMSNLGIQQSAKQLKLAGIAQGVVTVDSQTIDAYANTTFGDRVGNADTVIFMQNIKAKLAAVEEAALQWPIGSSMRNSFDSDADKLNGMLAGLDAWPDPPYGQTPAWREGKAIGVKGRKDILSVFNNHVTRKGQRRDAAASWFASANGLLEMNFTPDEAEAGLLDYYMKSIADEKITAENLMKTTQQYLNQASELYSEQSGVPNPLNLNL